MEELASKTAMGVLAAVDRAIITNERIEALFGSRAVEFIKFFREFIWRIFTLGASLSGMGLGALLGLPYQMQIYICDQLAFKGYDRWMAARKIMIRHHLNHAAGDGTEQVIIIGSGFDSVGFEFASQHPNIQVIEVDSKETLSLKAQAIRAVKDKGWVNFEEHSGNDSTLIAFNDRVSFRMIAADIGSEHFENQLRSHSYDPSKKTLVIIEGVTMYLTGEENKRLLDMFGTHLNRASRILVGFIDSVQRVGRTTSYLLANAKAAYKFSRPREAIGPYLAERGLRVDSTMTVQSVASLVGGKPLTTGLEYYASCHPSFEPTASEPPKEMEFHSFKPQIT